MNPVDRARKEAKKKEIKKNKQQRQLIRTAILQGKDPSEIIAKLEEIDHKVFDVTQTPPSYITALKDKRKRLKETLDKILNMYEQDDQEKWLELKNQITAYKRKQAEIACYFEAVKLTQQVKVEDIPLPSECDQTISAAGTSGTPPPDVPRPFLGTHTYSQHYMAQQYYTHQQYYQQYYLAQQQYYTNHSREDQQYYGNVPQHHNAAQQYYPAQQHDIHQQQNVDQQRQKPMKRKLKPSRENNTNKKTLIEAKPQLKNLAAEATKFVPTVLELKKMETKKKLTRSIDIKIHTTAQKMQNNHETYEQFMEEMQDLI